MFEHVVMMHIDLPSSPDFSPKLNPDQIAGYYHKLWLLDQLCVRLARLDAKQVDALVRLFAAFDSTEADTS